MEIFGTVFGTVGNGAEVEFGVQFEVKDLETKISGVRFRDFLESDVFDFQSYFFAYHLSFRMYVFLFLYMQSPTTYHIPLLHTMYHIPLDNR